MSSTPIGWSGDASRLGFLGALLWMPNQRANAMPVEQRAGDHRAQTARIASGAKILARISLTRRGTDTRKLHTPAPIRQQCSYQSDQPSSPKAREKADE
jgi:hypothetical protein